MKKEIIKPLQTPDFVNELVEQIKEAIKALNPEFEVVVQHPDFTKTIGVKGNYLTTNIFKSDPEDLAMGNCVRISHLRSKNEEGISVVFDRAPAGDDTSGKVFVMGYISETDMDSREAMAVGGLNSGYVLLVDRLSKIPSQVACFLVSNKMPSEK